ncbi:MAG: tRNA (N(6)-L-threonylcarbamoyladenosine(37)-C(2))-methylthiotransferase MtaB [Muribaculaceae bacterium]|nr:tRNA (N(6)-L-threonylcarbamoyladenosine(37)-C(2))-methylthiotransferase MtaB [Muribaculaceae bacterium]
MKIEHTLMTETGDTYKVAYHTLGCKLNFAETSAVGKALADKGFLRAQPGETPDICVVNTCSVTEMADKKGRSLIRRLNRRWPQVAIVVTGCYAQLKPQEVASLPGVVLVIGNNDKSSITTYIEQWLAEHRKVVDVLPAKDIRRFTPSCEKGDRTRWMLKVQDGCDYWCTYCTIPMARGRSRSGSIEELVAQAEQVARAGGKEIVLTGVNVGDFGKGTDKTFFDLIKALDAVEGIERYRISSIEPNLLTEEIIQWVATEARAFMPHFHIPLQSGSDAVLKLMRRHYDTALFRSRVELIRRLMPDAFIGVDIMAGTRGETEKEWLKGLDFVRSLPVQQLHVFPYSERPNTRALELAHPVSQEDKHKRAAILIAESKKKYDAFRLRAEGEVRPVLWEHPHPGSSRMHGFTDNYLRVETPFDSRFVDNISLARLGSPIDDETLSAAIINE